MVPDTWLLTEHDGGIYQFLESAIIHTLHERRATYTSKHLSEMDLLTVEYNLIQAKRAYLRFTYKKKCCICDTPISDKVKLLLFLVLRGVSQCKCVPPGLCEEIKEYGVPSDQARLREVIQVLIKVMLCLISNKLS